MSALALHVRQVENFPKQGVKYRDISPLLEKQFPATIENMAKLLDSDLWQSIDAIAGVDARGFIFASGLAFHKQKRLVMIRKSSKLPPPVISLSYQLEYGNSTLEIKEGQGRILIVDDVLATGGTLRAAGDLCTKAGYNVQGFLTLIDLQYLNQFNWRGLECKSLLQYHE